jgi:hypothetical protein
MQSRRTYTRVLGAALLSASVLALLECGGASNQHQMGEVCNPYAVGSGTLPDGGQVQGDCISSLTCACAIGGSEGCVCSTFCATDPDAGLCQPGYSCISARNVINQTTNVYCFPGDGGS